MRCPDENVLAEYVDHVLDEGRRRDVEQHLDRCVTCRMIVSDLARMKSVTDDKSVTLAYVADPNAPTRGATPTLDLVRHRKRTAAIVPGTMIDNYEVTGVLGAGGMGIVFAAIHPRIGKKAAIKILKRDQTVDASSIVRFENEARAVNAIGHPNIVDIFGFGELPNGDPYYVMEHVDGKSLHEWINTQGAVSLERAMPILRQICDALSAAHERGIIHRDLKPANIMIAGPDDAPRVKVLDFGLAKMAREEGEDIDELTMPGVAMGTPAFMSPEQFMGTGVDQRTDVYALGVIIYQMLCGTYPFQGATPSAIEDQHFHHTPAKPSTIAPLPERIDQVASKALAKSADDRYASVRALRDELEKCVREVPRAIPPAQRPSLVEAPTVPDRPAVAPRARKPRWIVVGAAFTVATTAFAWILFGRSQPKQPEVRAEPAPPIVTPIDPPAPAPQPIAEPPPAPIAETKPVEEPPSTPAVAAKKPARRPAKKVTTPRPAKPGSAAPVEDDDKMLLEGGSVKKAPR